MLLSYLFILFHEGQHFPVQVCSTRTSCACTSAWVRTALHWRAWGPSCAPCTSCRSCSIRTCTASSSRGSSLNSTLNSSSTRCVTDSCKTEVLQREMIVDSFVVLRRVDHLDGSHKMFFKVSSEPQNEMYGPLGVLDASCRSHVHVHTRTRITRSHTPYFFLSAAARPQIPPLGTRRSPGREAE